MERWFRKSWWHPGATRQYSRSVAAKELSFFHPLDSASGVEGKLVCSDLRSEREMRGMIQHLNNSMVAMRLRTSHDFSVGRASNVVMLVGRKLKTGSHDSAAPGKFRAFTVRTLHYCTEQQQTDALSSSQEVSRLCWVAGSSSVMELASTKRMVHHTLEWISTYIWRGLGCFIILHTTMPGSLLTLLRQR